MSTHRCDVIRIKLEPHPNADALSIVKVLGYECAVRTEDWEDGDLAVYIPPDSVVPQSEEFAFLGDHLRIRVRKFRGRYSQGLLVTAPAGVEEGDDCMEMMNIEHYEPPLPMSTGGDNEKGPPGWFPKYDVENYRRYSHLFQLGEEIVATEKIHGCSARFVWAADRMWAGSRINWKKQDAKNLWWQTLERNSWIEEWCCVNPNLVVYGEVFGRVQILKYGANANDVFFAAFDILDKDRWVDHDEARRIGNGLQWVPEVYRGPFDEAALFALAEKDSIVPGAEHCREGIVVKPLIERQDPEVGRVQLKIVGNRYLEKS